MSSKALTDGEVGEVYALVAEGVPKNRGKMNPDAIRAHLGDKSVSHEAQALFLGMNPHTVIALLSVKQDDGLFKDLGTNTTLPKIDAKFAAADVFAEGKMIGGVKVWSCGQEFEALVKDFVEEGADATVIQVCELTDNAKDERILKARGGKKKAAIELCQLEAWLEAGNGQDGRLYAAYIKGTDKAVRFRCDAGIGWRFFAFSIPDSIPWGTGYRFLLPAILDARKL